MRRTQRILVHELPANTNFEGCKPHILRGDVCVFRGAGAAPIDFSTWFAEFLSQAGRHVLRAGQIQGSDHVAPVTLDRFAASASASGSNLYLHDYPTSALSPSFGWRAVDQHLHLLPSRYRARWHKHARLFWGAAGTQTPLHFDKLGTHNLFIHLEGTKKFRLAHRQSVPFAYMTDWKWSSIHDPRHFDSDRFPLFAHVHFEELTMHGGDVAILPRYTLHQVSNSTQCLSINIDWHTRGSALLALTGGFRGMPLELLPRILRHL
jgi:hypothetical protein